MKKIAIIYYSGTGNTEEMAKAIFDGCKDSNGNVELFNISDISSDDALGYDVLALGCPAMGIENLEEGEFEPFMEEIEGNIGDKEVAIFGSYGWGDGEWMRVWQQRIIDSGASLVEDGLMCNETPDDTIISACKQLGSKLASL